MKVFTNSRVGGEPANMAVDGVSDLKLDVSSSLDECAGCAKVFTNNHVGGEPANSAVDGVSSLQPGVSSSLGESAVSSDCGSDSCKLKADTAVNNEARRAGGITKP